MNLVKKLDQYCNDNLILCEAIKNNVMNEGIFIRLLYATSRMTLNGIYLLVTLKDISCEAYYNKFKCMFPVTINNAVIEQVKQIEEDILSMHITTKLPSYKIYEQISHGYIKLFATMKSTTECNFILKISGIWETQFNYGLTYKFMKIDGVAIQQSGTPVT